VNSETGRNWFEETFGACPHGHIKPYCAQCTGDELEAEWEEKRRQREGRGRAKLEETVKRQSSAIDRQSAEIQRLRVERERLRGLLAARSRRRRLFGRTDGAR
jgi:hypothetical protein